MILREEDSGAGAVIAIGQPAHAWICGQIARAWGNQRFAAPEPFEEVCLAAEQHDIGMAAWDASPRLDPSTGLPYGFMEMPIADHVALWSEAPRLARSQSRYAALLVSLHGSTLYGRRDPDALGARDAAAVRGYLAAQRSLQEALIATLGADRAYAAHAGPDAIERNRALIFAWDWISLALCMPRLPSRAPPIHTSDGGELRLQLAPGAAPGEATIDPWPLARDALTVRCDGRRLHGRYADEAELRAALEAAPWTTLELTLRRA